MELTSNQRITIILVFALYTAALLIYSLVTRKSLSKGKGDYLSKFYTGGRSGGIIITAMMVSAGVAGAGVFMGVPGFTYTFGATWMVCCFFSIGSNLMVLGLLGKRVGIVARRTNSKTFVELFMNRYNNSKVVGILCGISILFFLGGFAVSTITGGGRIFQILTGQDYRIGLGIFTALVILAALTGGIKGVASAMVIQGIVMTISVLVLFIMGVNSTGMSYTATIQSLMETNPNWFLPDANALKTTISFAILWGITTFTLPHVTMTALTYKDTKTLHRAIKIGTVVVAVWLLGLNGLCFITKYTFAEGTLATADLAIPSLAVKVMPAWAAGIVLAGVSGAVQSSMGGMVVSLAGTVVSDIYKNIFNKDAKPETVKKLNIVAIIVVSLVIFLLASNPPQLLAKLITYSTGGLTVVFFQTVLLGLFWKRANEYGATAGIVSGIILYLLIDKRILAISLGFNACIMATLLSTVIAVLVSLVTPKTPYGIIKNWFGRIQA